MRNLCSLLFAFIFSLVAPLTWAESLRKSSQQPDRGTRQNCQPQLRPTIYDSFGNEQQGPSYSNSYEQDNRRFVPGPDEVEDRNPNESDARDPGGF